MLNLFNSFRVPGVEYVEVFHDDTEDDLFYMLPELPSVLRGEDGKPAFHLMSFARDFTLMANTATELPAGELEGGLLSMTTQLAVSPEDQKRIRDWIQGGQGRLLRPLLEGTRFRMARVAAFSKPIRLAYPTYVDGAVSFGLLPIDAPTFVKGKSGSEKPSLSGSNLASYTALLGQEGVRLMRQGAEDGGVPASIAYTVKFVARIPSVSIHIYGDLSEIYKEIKEHTQVHEWYWQGNSHTTWSYPQVSSLQQIKEMTTSLHIDIDTGDFREGADPAAGESVTKQIESMALKLIETQIMPRFFAPGMQPGLQVDKLGTDPLAHAPGKTGPPAANNQMWLKNFTQEMTGTIDVTFSARANITVERHPNSDLLALLTAEEFKASITEADLSQPYFNLLDVPVRVTANFDTDPIAAIKVFLDYDHKDEKTGDVKKKTEEFLFDTNDDVFYFRTIMARDAEGRPKDTYRYRSQIVYKATAKTQETAEVETRDRNLLIGYDRLDCVQVKAVLGALPPGLVERTQIHFRYPGLSSPTAEADVFLTDIQTEGSWFTYTGGNASREYEYQVTYFMLDGQQMQMPVERSVGERLIVNAPFKDRLSVTFVAQGVFPPIANIIVSTRYVDEAADYDVQDVGTLNTPGQVWEWQVNLRDKEKRTFQYKVDVNFADGSSVTQDWQDGTEGTINVGQVTRELLRVEVVPTLIDFAKWKLVIVRLKYDDPANGLSLAHDVQLTAAGAQPGDGLVWNVPIKDPANKTFTWSVQAFGVDGTTRVDVPPTQTVDPLVLVQV